MNFADKFQFANHTDVGKKRQQNEDAMGFFEASNGNGYVFVVCDGMGGHLGGAVASQTAIKAIRYFLDLEYFADAREAIKQALTFANQEIYHKAQTSKDLANMGTTAVMVIYRQDQCFIGHVGDSRLYLYRDGLLSRVTKDHSYVQMLVDNHVISDDEAEQHPRKNEILRALGTEHKVDVEVRQTPFAPYEGDTLLLCSDGLNSMLKDSEIETLLDARGDIQQKALQLVAEANAKGGLDNITVQLINFLVGKPPIDLPAQNATQHSQRKLSDTNPMGIAYQDHSEGLKKKEDEELTNDTTKDNLEPAEVQDETPRPTQKRKKRFKEEAENDMIVSENSDDIGKLRKMLFQVFGGVFIVIFVYVMAQTVLEDVNFLGSRGSLKADSLKAIEIQDAFWKYFWDANPELKKTKDGITNTVKEVKQTYQELKEMKQRAKDAMSQHFPTDKINAIKNALPQNFSTKDLEALARKYGSKIDWILKANGLKNKEDIKKLDTLYIPKIAPKEATAPVKSDTLSK